MQPQGRLVHKVETCHFQASKSATTATRRWTSLSGGTRKWHGVARSGSLIVELTLGQEGLGQQKPS
jgi:hypothetical protein